MAGESEFTFVKRLSFLNDSFLSIPGIRNWAHPTELARLPQKIQSVSNFWGFLNPQPVPDSIRHCWSSQRNLINSNKVLAQLGNLCFGNKPFDKKDDIFFGLITPGDLIALIFTQLLPLRVVAWDQIQPKSILLFSFSFHMSQCCVDAMTYEKVWLNVKIEFLTWLQVYSVQLNRLR